MTRTMKRKLLEEMARETELHFDDEPEAVDFAVDAIEKFVEGLPWGYMKGEEVILRRNARTALDGLKGKP